ncbi:MAG: transketolase [Nitrospirae bacterium]|nr:transketolase [Nitrospirota bacterium]
MTTNEIFPIDLTKYTKLSFSLDKNNLTKDELSALKSNIKLIRAAIVLATGISTAKGTGGHTGGAFDVVPEYEIIRAFQRQNEVIHKEVFEDSGHRAIVHYVMAALDGCIDYEALLTYRQYKSRLHGHLEKGFLPCINQTTGRLGAAWGIVNGKAIANCDKKFMVFSTDGAMLEGSNAEAARVARAQNLATKIFIDDNNTTICAKPSDYMKGYDIYQTLKGHGINANICDGEDYQGLYCAVRDAINSDGPYALVIRRPMAPGLDNLEGTLSIHDSIGKGEAITYLRSREFNKAAEYLETVEKNTSSFKNMKTTSLLLSEKPSYPRKEFGKYITKFLDNLAEEQRKNYLLVDNDLIYSSSSEIFADKYPQNTVRGGPQERGNWLLASGFGTVSGHQAFYTTFSAFLEMIISEIVMGNLIDSNVLAFFSHAGVDGISDNNTHFAPNIFYADIKLQQVERNLNLYFPADDLQMEAVLERVINECGLRFVFSTRAESYRILKQDNTPYFSKENGYKFVLGKDEMLMDGTDGYIVTYGSMVYRVIQAVEILKAGGIRLGVVNKPHLNIVDEEMLKIIGTSPSVIVVEDQGRATGLGSKMGTILLERGFSPKFLSLGITKEGIGGQHEQIINQGLDPDGIAESIKKMFKY